MSPANIERVQASNADHDAIDAALSEVVDTRMRSACVRAFEVVQVAAGTNIPPLGLCIVLQGVVSLERNDEPLAEAGPGAHFYEDTLVLDAPTIVALAREEVRAAVLERDAWQALAPDVRHALDAALLGDLLTTHVRAFQQPINCCNLTALALGLTSLGFATDVDAIFKQCQLPVSYVVNDGMTLAELFDVACLYIHAGGLADRVSVECHFFDADVTSETDLAAALAESKETAGFDDIIIANFDVPIAHADRSFRGGHFALLAKYDSATGLVHMVDVNPEKYGKAWMTNTRRLHAAMVARDGTCHRARGLIRLSTRRGHGTRMQSLCRAWAPVDMAPHIMAATDRYTRFFQPPTINLGAFDTIAACLRTLGLPEIETDDLVRVGEMAPVEALSRAPSPAQLQRTIARYLENVAFAGIASRLVSYRDRRSRNEIADSRPSAAQWVAQELAALDDPSRVQILLDIDLNAVLGCSAVELPTPAHGHASHHRDLWCIAKAFDPATGILTLADTSAATPHMWQAPLADVCRGLAHPEDPTLIILQRTTDPRARDVSEIVESHRLVLFHCDDDADSHTLRCVLANIGVSDLKVIDVTRHELGSARLRRQLVAHSGRDEVPYLYLAGNCLGETEAILEMVRRGELQEQLRCAGISVLEKQQTPSLDNNMFGYPKGGLTGPRDVGRRRVLLCACGSSAADKIPEMIDRLVELEYEVKLLLSGRAEHFFEDFGMRRIRAKLAPSDIYRDHDEWSFRYTDFGMPVRACHLALCDWADCVVVAPVTCNTMAKVAHGIADNILTSVFVAWPYPKKPVILCPACNTDMWNNITTQDNVQRLRQLGARIEGPRSGLLSNGAMGIGMMAVPEQIVAAVGAAFDDLGNRASWVMKWGAQAAAADHPEEWRRIYRTIDEGVVDINVRAPDTGDTLLHYAAGGEGELTEDGISKGVPDLEAARELIRRGIDIDARNRFEFTSLHVACMNDSAKMVKLLLDAGADARPCLSFIAAAGISEPVKQLLRNWAQQSNVNGPSNP